MIALSEKQRLALAYFAIAPRTCPFAAGTISSLRKAGLVEIVKGTMPRCYAITDRGREIIGPPIENPYTGANAQAVALRDLNTLAIANGHGVGWCERSAECWRCSRSGGFHLEPRGSSFVLRKSGAIFYEKCA